MSALKGFQYMVAQMRDRARVVGFEVAREEITGLVLHLLQEVNNVSNIAVLEQRLTDIEHFDFRAARRAAEVCQASDYIKAQYPDSIKQLIDSVDRLMNMQQELGLVETIYAVEMLLDKSFMHLIQSIPPSDPAIAKVANQLKAKLAELTEQEVMDIWSKVLSEFDHNARIHFTYNVDVMGEDFFQLKDIDQARERIMTYLSKVKPALGKDLVENRKTAPPTRCPGIARLLATSGAHTYFAPQEHELSILRVLSRILFYWERLLQNDPKEIYDTLGINEKGKIQQNNDYQKLIEKFNDEPQLDPSCLQFLLNDLTQLGQQALTLLNSLSPIQQVLEQYQYNFELLCFDGGESYGESEDLNEELQIDLCEFLLERNIYSFGTDFPFSRIQLARGHAVSPFVIHASHFDQEPDAQALKKQVDWLFGYLNEHAGLPQAILLLFNRSDVQIRAPINWLRGRVLLLPLNVNLEGIMESKKALEIIEDDKEYIACHQRKVVAQDFVKHFYAPKTTADIKKQRASKK